MSAANHQYYRHPNIDKKAELKRYLASRRASKADRKLVCAVIRRLYAMGSPSPDRAVYHSFPGCTLVARRTIENASILDIFTGRTNRLVATLVPDSGGHVRAYWPQQPQS